MYGVFLKRTNTIINGMATLKVDLVHHADPPVCHLSQHLRTLVQVGECS